MGQKRFGSRQESEALQRKLDATSETRVGRGLVHKMLAAQKRERQQVLSEVARIKGFMPLLMKHRNGQRWSPMDRAELTEQLKAVAHLSPYLVIMVMPGSFLALPVLAWWLDRRRLHRIEENNGV